MRAIEAQVEQIRGLQLLCDTPLRLVDHESLQSYLIDQFSQNYLPRERSRFPDATVEDASSSREALTTPSAVTDVRVRGAEVTVVIAPDREASDAIVATVMYAAL